MLCQFGVLTIFRSADMPCMSTMKCECSVHLLLDMYVPYINHKSWTFHTSPVKRGRSVHLMCENYIGGNLREDQELDGNAGNLPRLILA